MDTVSEFKKGNRAVRASYILDRFAIQDVIARYAAGQIFRQRTMASLMWRLHGIFSMGTSFTTIWFGPQRVGGFGIGAWRFTT